MDGRVREPEELPVLLRLVKAAVDDLRDGRAMVAERRDDARQLLAGPVARRRMQDDCGNEPTGARLRRLGVCQDQLVRRKGLLATWSQTNGLHFSPSTVLEMMNLALKGTRKQALIARPPGQSTEIVRDSRLDV